MKIIGIIPARYKSTRFEGKPLADICGKPMIWWVYEQVKKVRGIDEIYVATDDERIENTCNSYNMNVIMTSDKNKTPTDRIYEVSTKIEADYYISINGDEPLIDSKIIEKVIPKTKKDNLYVANLMTTIKDPVQAVDSTNLKIVTNDRGEGVYISRTAVPYPKGSMDFEYKKHVGVYAFDKEALKYYHDTPRGRIETIEDIDLLRYIENHVNIDFIDVNSDSLSVDNMKDLEEVRRIVEKKLKNNKK